MKKTKSRNRLFWSAFLTGMSAPAMLFAADRIELHRVDIERVPSARDSMRGDWERLGNDFRTVISREKDSTKAVR